ncbi:hypothetical protein AURDEDRAFT_149795 [Auricularia subglabra TFB-10046 SS5]|nr:hypothetical protein AURDEDRAFT_149795 [Auricularia subglabra TFB-10046 SS5]
MSNICERAVHINFDRDERELAPRDTFVVLTGPDPEPPSGEGRRVGDVYLCNVDPVTRTFDGAWYFAGERDGWKKADLADLRAHVIGHPALANRILSISPDGTSVNWSKRDTIIRRERRARTLSRSMTMAHAQSFEPPKTPPPAGMRSAPVSPQRSVTVHRPAPLDPAAFVLPHPHQVAALFPPQTPPSSPARMRHPTTPQSARHPTTPLSARQPTTPQSGRSWRTAWSSPGSPGSYQTPDTSREASPRSPKYTVPQKRASVAQLLPAPFDPLQRGPVPGMFFAPPPPLAPVHELPEAPVPVDVFGPLQPARAAFRPDAPEFVPRSVPPAPVVYRHENPTLRTLVDEAVAREIAQYFLGKENRPQVKVDPKPIDPKKIAKYLDAVSQYDSAVRDLVLDGKLQTRPTVEEEILRRPHSANTGGSGATPSTPVAVPSDLSSVRSIHS